MTDDTASTPAGIRPVGSMRSLARMVAGGWSLLTARERVAALGVGAASLVASVVELAALSSTVPFVGLLIDPAALERYPAIGTALASLDLPRDRDALLYIGLGVIACLVVAFVFRMGVHILVERFSVRFTDRLIADTMRGCLAAPYAWLRSQNGAQLAQRLVTDVATVGQALYPVVLEILYGLFVLLLGVGAVIATSPWQATLAIALLGAIAIAILAVLNPLAARFAGIQRDKVILGNQRAVETFSGRKLVKASRAEAFFTRRYLVEFVAGNRARMNLNIVNKAIPTGTLLIGQIAMLVLAFTLVLSDLPVETVVAQLTFILLVLSRVLPAVSSMTGSINKLIKTEPSYRGYMALRREIGPWIGMKTGAADSQPAPAWQRLDLDGIVFAYAGAQDVQIRDVTLTVERGRSYGIAGPSGAGKSTLIDILLGLLAPTDGAVRVDGEGMDADRRDAWLSAVGYVPQEPFVMDDTLRRNVAFGRRDGDIDDHAIWRALEQAQLADIVRSWPEGLDTRLGDAGGRLSGGQRQRVAIARVLYRGATFLVLDEATNALDAVTEESINRTVRAIPGITSLTVAHRLSALRSCDTIFVMQDGRLVAEGPYDRLVETDDLFRGLAIETSPLGTAPPGTAPDEAATAAAARTTS